MEAFAAARLVRVVLTGSESTGKSTLAAELARHYGAALVPEFVRGFAEQKGAPIDFGDHGAIARGQMALEDAALARATRLIVQDTDLLSTVVYCRHYFGRCPVWLEEAAASRRPDLYLLCATDVEWVADGVRDRGHMRDEMQRLFAEAIDASGVRCVELSGDTARRLVDATRVIDRLVLKWSAGAPLE
jgi:NadR type nicotinamide-nucleotide adenylyltransferase